MTLSFSGMIALWAHGTSLGQVRERWRARTDMVAQIAAEDKV